MVLAGGKEISGLGVVTHFITILNNELIINKNSYIRLQIDNDCTCTIHLPYKMIIWRSMLSMGSNPDTSTKNIFIYALVGHQGDG